MKWFEILQELSKCDRDEVSKCYRKNGANVLAWHSIVISLQFFLKHYLWSTVKQVCLYSWVFAYVNQHTSGHRWELICENVYMFPYYLLHWNWFICVNRNICKFWVNRLRYIGALRTAYDHRTVSSKLQWRELKNQGTSLAFIPVVKILCFHCRRHGFDPWSGNKDHTCCMAPDPPKRKKATQRKPDSDYSRVQSSKL